MRSEPGTWAVEWTHGWAAVGESSFAAAWEHARAHAPAVHVYDRWPVIQAWLETVARAGGLQPHFARVTNGDGVDVRLAAVVAEYRGRLIARRTLEPAGQDLFGYQSPLCTGDAALVNWDGFWSTIQSGSAGFSDQALWRFVDPERAGSRFSEAGASESPVLSLTGATNLADLLARTSANHRGDVKRRLRRIAERGAVELWVAGPDDHAAAVDEFITHAYPVWVASSTVRGITLHDRPGFAEYCRRLLHEGLPGGFTHLSVLRVAGQSVAWHLGLQDRGRLYWWLPIHDAAWDSVAPGKVLLALLAEYLAAHDFEELHFLTGSQSYKLAWRPSLPPLKTVRWHASSGRGRAIAWYDRVVAGDS